MVSKNFLFMFFYIISFFPFPVWSMEAENSMTIECMEEENTKSFSFVPKHFTETLLYSTVRIETQKPNKIEIGTGFIYLFSVSQNDQEVPFLVTNKHVVEGVEELKFKIHESDLEDNPLNWILNVTMRNIQKKDVIWNKEKDIDLCALNLNPIFNRLNAELMPFKRKVYYKCLSKSDVMEDTSTLCQAPESRSIFRFVDKRIWAHERALK